MSDRPHRPMTLVGERETPDPAPAPSLPELAQRHQQQQQALQQEIIHRSAWKAGVLGSLNVATAILSIRLILLLAVCGAIALALIALRAPDQGRLEALGIYCLGVLIPLIWLAARGRSA